MKTSLLFISTTFAALAIQRTACLHVNIPAPTLAARQTSGNDNGNDQNDQGDGDELGGHAIVDGQTLTSGLNTVDGQVYTLTNDFLIGPSITDGPGIQINPSVTQAFGCQIVAGTQQGDCDGIEAQISSALATVTGNQQSSSVVQQTSTSSASSSSPVETNSATTASSGSLSSSSSNSNAAASNYLPVLSILSACAMGVVVAIA